MLRKRLIFTLIYSKGFFCQSRNFRLQKVGNIDWLERNYKFSKIALSLDELIIIDASKDEKNINSLIQVLDRINSNIFIPITVGGGIRSVEDAKLLFENGADKLLINSILFQDTDLVKQLISLFGSQSIVASIDYLENYPYISNGTIKVNLELQQYIQNVEALNIGEIYLNSISKDGTGFGYDFEVINKLKINTPLIIAGGAGKDSHLIKGLLQNNIDAVATANLFNFMGNALPKARQFALESGVNIAKWI